MSIESILVPKAQVPKRYLESLDGQIKQVLENKSIPNDVKFTLYNQILSKWNNVQEDLQKPTKLTVVPAGIQASNNTVQAPQKRVTATDKLHQFIKSIPLVDIDPSGTVTIDGNLIRKSNINKIVADFTQNSKTRAPTGSKQLAKLLKEYQVPLDYITNENRFPWFVDQYTEFPPHNLNKSWSAY